MSRPVAAINSLLPLGRRPPPIHRPSSSLATTSKHFSPSIAASAPHRPTETAFLGALARLLHKPQSRLESAGLIATTHCHTHQSPASLHDSFFATASSYISIFLLPKTATAEPVTDHISPPQLHIHLCIHCRAPTALLLPQHSSCILPINTRFGFTPIGWVE